MHRQCERLPFGLFSALRPFVFCDDGLRALFDLRKDAVEDAIPERKRRKPDER